MATVADTHHLTRRGSVWYYRRRVPDDLVSAVGKDVLQYSLDTRDKREAIRRREVEDLKWSARFATCVTEPANSPVGSEPQLSKSALVDLVRSHVEEVVGRFETRYAADPPESEAQKGEMRADIEIGRQVLQSADDPRADEWVLKTGQRLGARLNEADGVEALPYAVAAEVIRRGLLEISRRKLDTLGDDHRGMGHDRLFDRPRQTELRFGDLAEQHRKMRLAEAVANGVGRKFTDKLDAHVALVIELVGAEMPVSDVDFDRCQDARAVLARLPSNRTKIYGGLPLPKVIERTEADGRPLLSPTTQQSYLRTLTDILDLAVKKRLIPSNPAEGIAPLRRETVAAENRRLSFEPEQLQAFFHGVYYRHCAASGPEPFRADKEGWKFWLPLLALFTGARPNELCQLELNDIRQTESGTWYFDIVILDDDDDRAKSAEPAKRLKTATSRRKIPIHPQLMRIGLLRHIEGLRRGDGARLFPTLKPDAAGYLSSYPAKRFRETFLPQAIKLKERQSFYSFRHSFRDALRAIEAPPDTLQALGAWSQGRLVSDNYGTRSNPDLQRKYVEMIAFSGLDLSHLWVREGGS